MKQNLLRGLLAFGLLVLPAVVGAGASTQPEPTDTRTLSLDDLAQLDALLEEDSDDSRRNSGFEATLKG